MLNKIKEIFRQQKGKEPYANLAKNDTKEKKKCLKCLRKIDIDYVQCPFCRGSEFFF